MLCYGKLRRMRIATHYYNYLQEYDFNVQNKQTIINGLLIKPFISEFESISLYFKYNISLLCYELFFKDRNQGAEEQQLKNNQNCCI